MNSIQKHSLHRIAGAVIALSALSAGSATQASEVTDFAVPTGSTLTRAEVKAETLRAIKNGEIDRRNAQYAPSYDAASMPMAMPSQKTRADVREEARTSRPSADSVAGSYFVGGM